MKNRFVDFLGFLALAVCFAIICLYICANVYAFVFYKDVPFKDLPMWVIMFIK